MRRETGEENDGQSTLDVLTRRGMRGTVNVK